MEGEDEETMRKRIAAEDEQKRRRESDAGSKTRAAAAVPVKSTGMAADGGDFDATKPGAGREADRMWKVCLFCPIIYLWSSRTFHRIVEKLIVLGCGMENIQDSWTKRAFIDPEAGLSMAMAVLPTGASRRWARGSRRRSLRARMGLEMGRILVFCSKLGDGK